MFKVMAEIKCKDGREEKREFVIYSLRNAKEFIELELEDGEELIEILTKVLEEEG